MSEIEKKLFAPTGALSDTALNWYGRPIEKFDIYAQAFHLAAKKLAKGLSEEELRDIYACPVVYLYRHALELWLKKILFTGSIILRLEGQDAESVREILNQKHNLQTLWRKIYFLFKKVGWDWDTELKNYEKFIHDFSEADTKSFSFRYPVTLDEGSSLPMNFSFDLRSFCTHMDKFLERLDQIDCGLAGELDQMSEGE